MNLSTIQNLDTADLEKIIQKGIENYKSLTVETDYTKIINKNHSKILSVILAEIGIISVAYLEKYHVGLECKSVIIDENIYKDIEKCLPNTAIIDTLSEDIKYLGCLIDTDLYMMKSTDILKKYVIFNFVSKDNEISKNFVINLLY